LKTRSGCRWSRRTRGLRGWPRISRFCSSRSNRSDRICSSRCWRWWSRPETRHDKSLRGSSKGRWC
jgi:hypothetical protein